MISFDDKGAVFALTDRSELLLHDGDSDAPLWRETLDGSIVGVCTDGAQVAAVTIPGTVYWFDARTGAPRGEAAFGAPVREAHLRSPAGPILAMTEDRVLRLDGAGAAVKELVADRAIAMASRADGTVLVATGPGTLVTIAPDGTPATRTFENLAIMALAHHPQGFWILGEPGKLQRWDGAGAPAHLTSLPKGSKLDRVACHDRAIAIAWDRNFVAVLDWPSRDTLGNMQYLDRTIEGLDFGPWPWLGIALDEGDGNKLNLEKIQLHRSDTHPGRPHRRWMVSVAGPPKREPAAAAPAAAPAQEQPARASISPVTVAIAIGVLLVIFIYLATR